MSFTNLWRIFRKKKIEPRKTRDEMGFSKFQEIGVIWVLFERGERGDYGSGKKARSFVEDKGVILVGFREENGEGRVFWCLLLLRREVRKKEHNALFL